MEGVWHMGTRASSCTCCSRLQRLRTASSERPGSCAAISRQRHPICVTQLRMSSSSAVDHSLRGSAETAGDLRVRSAASRDAESAESVRVAFSFDPAVDAGGANALWASLFGDGRSGWADAAADESPNKTHAGSQWSVSGALAAAPGVGESTGRLAIAVDE